MKFKKTFNVPLFTVKFYLSLGYIDGPPETAFKYFDKKALLKNIYSLDPEIFDRFAIDIIVNN